MLELFLLIELIKLRTIFWSGSRPFALVTKNKNLSQICASVSGNYHQPLGNFNETVKEEQSTLEVSSDTN